MAWAQQSMCLLLRKCLWLLSQLLLAPKAWEGELHATEHELTDCIFMMTHLRTERVSVASPDIRPDHEKTRASKHIKALFKSSSVAQRSRRKAER